MHTHVTGSASGSASAPRRRAGSGFVTWLVAGALLALPGVSHAQEAVVTGTVTDDSGGVMPGVLVTAVHEAWATASRPSPNPPAATACRFASAATA